MNTDQHRAQATRALRCGSLPYIATMLASSVKSCSWLAYQGFRAVAVVSRSVRHHYGVTARLNQQQGVAMEEDLEEAHTKIDDTVAEMDAIVTDLGGMQSLPTRTQQSCAAFKSQLHTTSLLTRPRLSQLANYHGNTLETLLHQMQQPVYEAYVGSHPRTWSGPLPSFTYTELYQPAYGTQPRDAVPFPGKRTMAVSLMHTWRTSEACYNFMNGPPTIDTMSRAAALVGSALAAADRLDSSVMEPRYVFQNPDRTWEWHNPMYASDAELRVEEAEDEAASAPWQWEEVTRQNLGEHLRTEDGRDLSGREQRIIWDVAQALHHGQAVDAEGAADVLPPEVEARKIVLQLSKAIVWLQRGVVQAMDVA